MQEGPDVTDADWHRMLDVLETIPGDWLIASGSLEHGMPEDIYARVARAATRPGTTLRAGYLRRLRCARHSAAASS